MLNRTGDRTHPWKKPQGKRKVDVIYFSTETFECSCWKWQKTSLRINVRWIPESGTSAGNAEQAYAEHCQTHCEGQPTQIFLTDWAMTLRASRSASCEIVALFNTAWQPDISGRKPFFFSPSKQLLQVINVENFFDRSKKMSLPSQLDRAIGRKLAGTNISPFCEKGQC